MKKDQKSRWFVVTQWNMDCDYEAVIGRGQIRYIAYGEETCPTTGRRHHQCFVYFHNKKGTGKTSCKKIGKLFGSTQAWVEPLRGSIKENESYCGKENTLTKIGEEPKQGARGDLEETRDAIAAGTMSVDEICMDNPQMFHMYGRTMERMEQIALRRQFRHPDGTHPHMTKGIWVTGPSGCGKSHFSFEGYSPETHYAKNLNEDWWDGYRGQETVIFNEFRGQVTFSELLDLVDKWPKTVKWRNREPVPFLAKTLIVTSVLTPEQCYHGKTGEEPWEQFHRRFELMDQKDLKCPKGNIGTFGLFEKK